MSFLLEISLRLIKRIIFVCMFGQISVKSEKKEMQEMFTFTVLPL